MKKIEYLELVSAILTLLSKIALVLSNVIGWPLAVSGYILIAVYNFKQKYTVLASTVVGMSVICAYGWYKWSQTILGTKILDHIILILYGWYDVSQLKVEVKLFDYITIALTIIFAGIIYIVNVKKDGLIGHLQAIVTVTALSAWLLISFDVLIWGWTFMLTSHLILAYLYFKKEAKYYVTLQFVSMGIALFKIITIIY